MNLNGIFLLILAMVLKLDILGDLAKGRKTSYPNLLAMLLHSALTDHVNCLHQMSGQVLPFILASFNLSVSVVFIVETQRWY